MKKITALGLVSLMMVASLTGCGRSKYLLDVDYSDYVKLCDYKGVEATKVVYEISDEDVQEEIEYNLYDYVEYVPVEDRGVTVGDYANITYTAVIDGKENEDYSGEEEEVLVGEGYLYPDLEDALVGMKSGESKEVKVELTEDYVEESLVGKTATMNVTVNEISVEELPEYNLDFVKEYTEYDTLEEYEAYVKENLEASKKEEYQYVAVDEIFTYVLENSEFDGYPEELYAQCEQVYDSNNEYYASMYGMEVADFLEMFGIDEETRKEEIEANVNYELVISAIAQEEKIDVTEKEVTEYVEDLYEDYGYESAEAFLEDYSEEEVGYELIYQKVCDFLYEHAKFVEVSEEDYLATQEAEYYGDYEEETTEEDISTEEDTSSDDLESSVDLETLKKAAEDALENASEVTSEESSAEATTEEVTTEEATK